MRHFFRRLALYAFHVLFVRPVLRFFVGVRYRRRSLVPEGACLLVANHNSHLDGPVLLSLLPLRRLAQAHPVAAADYFGETWLRRTMAMVLMNALAIERNPSPGHDPLANVIRAIEEGRTIILFPEGTRGEAGVVAPFRAGVGRLVRACPGLPVVPVFLQGPERTWPRGEVVPVPQGIDAYVGRPRTYDPNLEAREIADLVRQDVLSLAPAVARPPGPAAAPVHVAFCGGPGAERRAAVESAVALLSQRCGRAVGWTNRIVVAEGGALRGAGTTPIRAKAWHGLAARIAGARAPYDGPHFARLVRRARIESGLCADPEAGAVVTEGSSLVDVLTAGLSAADTEDRDLYQRLQRVTVQRRIPVGSWWRTAREDPEAWLLNTLSLARLHEPAVLVLLDADPALRRIAELLRRTRRAEVVEAGEGGPPPERIAEAFARAAGRGSDAVVKRS